MYGAHQSLEKREKRAAATEGHRAQRVTVISALHRDEFGSPGVASISVILVGNLERDLDRC